jgi:hypothetical protein
MRLSPEKSKPRCSSAGLLLLAGLFSLVFLMLFTGLFSTRGRGLLIGERQVEKVNITSLSLINPWLPPPGGNQVEISEPARPFSVADLIPGDILLGRCAFSPVPTLDPLECWTHACIYIGNNKVVVAGNPLSGVVVDALSSWMYPYMTWVTYLRVDAADEGTRKRAVDFALSKAGEGYHLNWLSRHLEGDTWYCSELVWAAYYHASGGAIDLQRKPDIFGVSPDEIYESPLVTELGGHYGRKPDTISSIFMKALVLCMLAGGLVTIMPGAPSASRPPSRRPQVFFPLERRKG